MSITELNNNLGNTDISSIGDGTITGAISELNNKTTPSLLWTGSWSGGSIAVPSTDKYAVFAVAVASSGNRILVTKNSTKTRVTGILGAALSTDNNQYIDIMTATISGNTWTMDNKHEVAHIYNGNHTAAVISFSEIYGLIEDF